MKLFLVVLIGLCALNSTAFADNTQSTDLEFTSSQYWTHSDTSSLDITGNLSFEAWINLESLPDVSTNDYVIMSKWNSGTNRSYRLIIPWNPDNTKINFSISSDGSTISNALSDTGFVSTSTWIHVAVSYDASAGSAQFYKNGSVFGSALTGLPSSIFNSSATFSIGAEYDAGTPIKYFDGLIDDARLWNTTIGSTQVETYYSCSIDATTSGLVSNWLFDGDGTDATLTGNDLTNNNSATFSSSVPYTTCGTETFNSITMSTSTDAVIRNFFELWYTLTYTGAVLILAYIVFKIAKGKPHP